MEKLSKGNVYLMKVDEAGNEKHVEMCNLDGTSCTGEPCMSARTGTRTNRNYILPLRDAELYLLRWLGEGLLTRLCHGESLTLAYKKDLSYRYDKLQSGDELLVFAFDIHYTKGNHYSADGMTRYKFIFTKA